MRLVSVSVSLPRAVEFRGRRVSTSIFKEPVNRRVPLRRLSLEGDWQADLRSHGGLNKAVYASRDGLPPTRPLAVGTVAPRPGVLATPGPPR